MSWNIFRSRPKKFLGIDIGTSSIRIVEMGKKGKTLQLENYGEVKTPFIKKKPFRVFEKDTLLLSESDTAKAIQSINLEAGIRTREANFSISDFCSFFTTLELPSMSKEEISQAVRYRVRPYIPLPLTEITLDWIITEGEVSKTPLKILVAAIPNSTIDQYKTIASLSNLVLRFLEPEVFALVRSSVKDKNKIIGLIDIGDRSTTCSIVEKGILKKSYSFNIGGNDLTEAIAKSLNIDYNKAEVIKRKYGLSFAEKGPEGFPEGVVTSSLRSEGIDSMGYKIHNFELRKILSSSVDLISEEVKKTFRSFYRAEGKEVEKIILSGGTALLFGLKEYFSAELKKEVTITNPFSNILYPAVLKQDLIKLGPSYAISVGLASKGFE